MALFFTIRDKSELNWSQMLRKSVFQTYGAEKLWEDDKELTPLRKDEFVLGHEAQVEVGEGEDPEIVIVYGEDYSDIIAKRKFFNPLKLIEFVVCFAMIAIDQALLRFGLWFEKSPSSPYSDNKPALTKPSFKRKEYLGLRNPGLWLRGIAYITMSLVYGVVKCITSPLNWIVHPIVNYCRENWEKGGMPSAKPFIMLAAGIFLSLVVVLSLLAMAGVALGPFAPLALIPAIPLITQLALSWVISLAVVAGIASMVVTHRIVTILPEAWEDAKAAVFDNKQGFDNKEALIDDKCPNQELYNASNAPSYIYFNEKFTLYAVSIANTNAGLGGSEAPAPEPNIAYPSRGGHTGPDFHAPNPNDVTNATPGTRPEPTQTVDPRTTVSYGKFSNPTAS